MARKGQYIYEYPHPAVTADCVVFGYDGKELKVLLIKRGKESGRADDNEETIKKRLVVYHQQTQPLIEWYKQEGLHHHINGLGTLDRIFGDIQKVIDNL